MGYASGKTCSVESSFKKVNSKKVHKEKVVEKREAKTTSVVNYLLRTSQKKDLIEKTIDGV